MEVGSSLSRETEAMFLLTAHLRGYRRKDIDIEINKDGTRISICGTKAVQEKVIRGWLIQNNKVEVRGFDKVFQIPQGVVLDKIKAKFDEEESILTITMPKLVKGISGSVIEEVSSGRIKESQQNPEEIQLSPEKQTEEKEDTSGRERTTRSMLRRVGAFSFCYSVGYKLDSD